MTERLPRAEVPARQREALFPGVESIAIEGRLWTVTMDDGLAEAIPGPVELVSPIELQRQENCLVTIARRRDKVLLSKSPYGGS